MLNAEINYKGFNLHYGKSGSGEKILLVFHGYGQTIEEWHKFLIGFENHYTIYYFQLFGHGNSQVNQEAVKKGLRHPDWQNIFSSFLAKEKISVFSLLAYSLGAKLGLLTAQYFAGQTEKTILMAPDGVKPDFAQIFLLRNQPGRWLLQWFHRNPGVLNKSLLLAHKSGIINHKAHEYFRQQTLSRDNRNFVLTIWYIYRHLRPDIHQSMRSLSGREQSFYLIYGTKDSLIHRRYIETALARRPKKLKGENFPMKAGHQLMIEEVKEILTRILNRMES